MNKQKSITETAIRLFASQGYEATTSLQIAIEVGVTEPTVYYYYKNKASLFSAILEIASDDYFAGIDALKLSYNTAFDCIVALIKFHFSIIADKPEFMRILLRSCPARLEDPNDTCTKIYRDARSKLKDLISNALEKGINSGEFYEGDIDATSNMLIAMLNGIMRQQIAAMDTVKSVEAATTEFCRNALVIKN